VKSDVPLQFPPTFTFVFRAFTTLDGVGKTLDPSYDLTRIAQPYLKELVDLRDGNAYISVLNSWAKRLGWRREDIFSLVQSPRRVAHIDDVTKRLEQGDLKLQVLELLHYTLRLFTLFVMLQEQ
jgi:predicted unusual protein kinase regulating ubiquinone biosynthesis (AarF/ABC1/UbiB family)